MNFEQALRDLNARQPEHMPEPSLDRISALADLLAGPQLIYPTIHIAGTNGKTTTARLATALACEHGLATGTFISPHLTSVTERLSVCGDPITEVEFGDEYERLIPYLDRVTGLGPPVTYFEALTALAFLWFADKPVALGVFEVGMGGSWDATNLVRGDVAVLCPIGLDHLRELGPTLADVAGEKAGIIKEGGVAVVRAQRPEAMAVIEARVAAVGASILLEGRDFAVSTRAEALAGQSIGIEGLHGSYSDVFLALFGEPSARNAAAAVTAYEALLGRGLDDRALRAALGSVTSPGRVEVAGRRPLVVLDGAHNPDATASLATTLRSSFRWDRLHLVVAMFEDKDVEGALANLAPLADRAYAARNSGVRSAPAERVADALRGSGTAEVEIFGSVADALAAAREEAAQTDLILVTGSFYTVGDARRIVLGA